MAAVIALAAGTGAAAGGAVETAAAAPLDEHRSLIAGCCADGHVSGASLIVLWRAPPPVDTKKPLESLIAFLCVLRGMPRTN